MKKQDEIFKYILGCAVLIVWGAIIIGVFLLNIPESKDQIITHMIGVVEGAIIAMVGYYFGASNNSK